MLSSDKNVETIAQLVEVLKHYLGLQKEYVKLDIIDKVVRLLTAMALAVIFFLLPFVVAGWRLWWGGCEIYRTVLLIQQPEHPQRDAVAVADFGVIDG